MSESDTSVKYETKTVRAVRGLESRIKERRQKEGWELVSEDRHSMLRTELTFRRVKKSLPKFVLPVAIGGAVVLVAGLFTIGVTAGNTPKDVPAVDAAASTPTSSESAAPSEAATPASPAASSIAPAAPTPASLDDVTAAQFLAYQWQAKFQYGGTVHWIMDRITTHNADGSFTFKMSATVKNAYGAEMNATIEGDVSGTHDAPVITDSILYTGDGTVVDF